MERKIHKLLARLSEVEEALGHPAVFEDQKKYRTLAQEYARLNEIKNLWQEIQRFQKQIDDNGELLKVVKAPDFAEALREDSLQLATRLADLRLKLENLLVPPDPNDHRNTILELRAGTGGDEAALFVADCARMYKLFADRQGWRYELL